MEIVTIGLGWVLGAWQIARYFWPGGVLHVEPAVTTTHHILIGGLAALLFIGRVVKRRERRARELVQGEVDQLTKERDEALRRLEGSFRMGMSVGECTGFDKGRRLQLRALRRPAFGTAAG